MAGENTSVQTIDYSNILTEISNKLNKIENIEDNRPKKSEVSKFIGKKIPYNISSNKGKEYYEEWAYKEYDLDKDGDITINDVYLAKPDNTPSSIVNELFNISERISTISKDQFIKECAMRLYTNILFSNETKSDKELAKESVERANILASYLFK